MCFQMKFSSTCISWVETKSFPGCLYVIVYIWFTFCQTLHYVSSSKNIHTTHRNTKKVGLIHDVQHHFSNFSVIHGKVVVGVLPLFYSKQFHHTSQSFGNNPDPIIGKAMKLAGLHTFLLKLPAIFPLILLRGLKGTKRRLQRRNWENFFAWGVVLMLFQICFYQRNLSKEKGLLYTLLREKLIGNTILRPVLVFWGSAAVWLILVENPHIKHASELLFHQSFSCFHRFFVAGCLIRYSQLQECLNRQEL